MKYRKSVISLVMVFIMAFTLIPRGVFGAENSSAKAKETLLKQQKEFEADRDRIREQEREGNQIAQPGSEQGTQEQDQQDAQRESQAGAQAEDQEENGIGAESSAEGFFDKLFGEEAPLRSPELMEEEDEVDGRIIEEEGSAVTYELADGSYVTRIYADPITYTDEKGRTRRIDNTLKERRSAYENKENTYELTLPKNGDEIAIEDNGMKITLSPLFGTLKDAAAEENAVRYNDAAEGIDLQYTALGGCVKEDIILMQPTELEKFQYRIEAAHAEDEKGKLAYRIEDNVLNIYEKKKLLYTISAPVMEDAEGNLSMDITLSLAEKDGGTILTIEPDQKWLCAPERVYPVTIDPTIALTKDNLEWHLVENGKSGGRFKAGPDVDHRSVTYLYAGYENGSLLGSDAVKAGARYGQTRSYIKINYDFAGNLPDDAIITAYLKGYKYAGDPPAGTRVYCKMVNSGWRASTCTWNTQPENHSIIAAPIDVSADGWKSWDISTAVREWKNGAANHGLVLAPENESQQAVCFSGPGNPHGKNPMYLDIYWTVPNAVDENLPLSTPGITLRPLTQHQGNRQVFTGLIADGIVRPQLDVVYALRESEGDVPVAVGVFEKADWGRRYPNTNLVKGTIPFTLGYTGLFEGNWQTDGLPVSLMEQVTPYYVAAVASGQAGTTPEGKSDEFIIYEFSKKDTYPYVAKYYGTTVEQIVKDNRPHDYLGTVGSSMFIRNPKYNKTTRYTRPAALSEDHSWDIIYANLGRGSCTDFDLEPINTSTGNFLLEAEDAQNADYTDDFSLARTYNSIGDKQRGVFGYGWNFAYEQSITAEGDRYIYNTGDGRRFAFEKDADGRYTSALSPYMTLTEHIDEKQPKNNRYSVTDEREKLLYQFDCYGLLTAVTDEKGLSITVGYDGNHMLKTVTTKNGSVYAFTLNDEGTVREITMPSGHKMQYEYADNCLTAFTNADGDTIRYRYGQNHLMTSWSDGNGVKQVENTYDEYGRVTKQQDAAGKTATLHYEEGMTIITSAGGNERIYSYDDRMRTEALQTEAGREKRTYDDTNRLTRLTDAEGNTSLYIYDEKGNLIKEEREGGRIWSGAYDASGHLVTETDFNGNTTKRTYDAAGNLLTETYADGSGVSFAYDAYGRQISYTNEDGVRQTTTYQDSSAMTETDGQGNSTRICFDAMGREISRIDAEGIEQKTIYSPAGKKTGIWTTGGFSERYGYDHGGNCISITDGAGNTSTMAYDAQNQITAVTDGNGDTTRYGYDAEGNEIWEKNEEGEKITRQYDARGNMTAETDGGGHTSCYEYDGLDRLVKEINPAGGKTSYEYAYETENITQETGAEGTIKYTYDKNGNRISVRTDAGAVTAYVVDARDRIIGVAYPSGLMQAYEYSKAGNLLRIKDSNGREYKYRYDENGNLLAETDALGNQSLYTYDKAGRLIEKTDAAGNTSVYAYDGAGNITCRTNPDGSTAFYAYDGNSNLVQQTDENGNTVSYEYDGLSQLTKETDALGGVTVYAYDKAERLISVTDTRGYTQCYEYDGAGNLKTYTDQEDAVYQIQSDSFGNPLRISAPCGGLIVSEYDAYGRIVKQSDREGYVKSYEYDSAGRLERQQDNAGSSIAYSYDAEGNLTAEKDALGRKARYAYDIYGNLACEITQDQDVIRYAYDAADRMVQMTENDGSVTRIAYDALGNIIEETLAGNRTYTYTYDYAARLTGQENPLGEKTLYRYDAAGNLEEETRADGSSLRYDYDALYRAVRSADEEGNETAFTYDSEGNLLKETDPKGGCTEYLYDGRGQVVKEMDPRGAVTQYEYDKAGNLVKTIYPGGGKETRSYDTKGNLREEKNRSGAVSRYAYAPDGKLVSQTEENGYQISYAYDKAGRITKAETSEGAVRAFRYDAYGNIVRLTEETGNVFSYTYDKGHRVLSRTDSNGGSLRYAYDEAGNNTKIVYPGGGSITYSYDKLGRVISEKESSLAKIRYTYDTAGNLVQQSQKEKTEEFAYDKTGNLLTRLSAEGRKTAYTYDANGLVTSVTDPLKRITSYEYDESGNLLSETDALGGMTLYAYDVENNCISLENQMGEKLRYSYDKAGRLVHAQDDTGAGITYHYDKTDNLIETVNADGSRMRYSYDKMGNLTKEESPSGKVTKYAYDASSRMTEKINPDGSRIRYDYDVLSNLIKKTYSDASKPAVYGYDAQGSLITMDDESGKSSRTYDELGRISTVTDAKGQKLSYSYDEYGRINKISYPKGREVVYNYDKDDNITRVSDSKGITAEFTYDAAGNIITCDRSDGTETSYAYDEKDNLVSLENSKGTHILSAYSYEYDKAGRITKETERKDGKTNITSFTYDKAGRLNGYIRNEGGKLRSTTYGYDAAGNRISITKGGDKGTITVTYNEDGQAISEKNSKTGDKIKYIYDDNGNLVKKKIKGKTVLYEYDIENRLRSVSQGGQILMATTYDGLGNKTFQMSRKHTSKDSGDDEAEDAEDDEDSDKQITSTNLDPDIFCYGMMQGGMKMSSTASPTLIAAIGNALSDIWHGIRTIFTGNYKEVNPSGLDGIILPANEDGSPITYDLTYYLNDTAFNDNTQALYQYDSKGREKASYAYGPNDERIAGDLTRRATRYTDDRAGLYTYLYDGQGNVTQNLRDGKEANSYYYDPFGKAEGGVEANDIIFGYNGEEYTEATGLQYLRQRHYDPAMGAFQTKDLYRGDLYEPASQDRYSYAENDPVNYNDPGGDKKTSKNPKKSGNGKTSGMAAGGLIANMAKQIAKTARTAAVQAAAKTAAKASQKKSSSQKTLTGQEIRDIADRGLKAIAGLKVMAKSLQAGVSCKGNRAQLASQYNGYVKGNSKTAEKDFMAQKQTRATMIVGMAGLAASVGGLAIGGTGIPAGTGTALMGSLKAKLVAVLNKLPEVARKAVKLTTLINLVEDMKKKVSGDEEKFPINPNDFNPKGLIKREYKNGEIIKWHDPNTGKAVYEWNKDTKYGDHYHYTPDGKTRMPNDLGETHLNAGDIVPPYDNKE